MKADRRIAGGARPGGETRLAVASAAGLYVIGGSLIATSFLLPEVSSPAGAAAVAGDAMLTALALLWFLSRGRESLELAWAADLWGIAIIVVLCASTGGAIEPVRDALLLRGRPRGCVPAAPALRDHVRDRAARLPGAARLRRRRLQLRGDRVRRARCSRCSRPLRSTSPSNGCAPTAAGSSC